MAETKTKVTEVEERELTDHEIINNSVQEIYQAMIRRGMENFRIRFIENEVDGSELFKTDPNKEFEICIYYGPERTTKKRFI